MSIAFLITLAALRELLRLLAGDFATSIIPGWHTTIHSNEWILTIGALLILFVAWVAMGLFRLTNILIEQVWNSNK